MFNHINSGYVFRNVITFSVVKSWSRNFMAFPDFYLAKIGENIFSFNIVHLQDNVFFTRSYTEKKIRKIFFTR